MSGLEIDGYDFCRKYARKELEKVMGPGDLLQIPAKLSPCSYSNCSKIAARCAQASSFQSDGVICIEVPATEIEGEHDLEWLRDKGFEPSGTLAYAEFNISPSSFIQSSSERARDA